MLIMLIRLVKFENIHVHTYKQGCTVQHMSHVIWKTIILSKSWIFHSDTRDIQFCICVRNSLLNDLKSSQSVSWARTALWLFLERVTDVLYCCYSCKFFGLCYKSISLCTSVPLLCAKKLTYSFAYTDTYRDSKTCNIPMFFLYISLKACLLWPALLPDEGRCVHILAAKRF